MKLHWSPRSPFVRKVMVAAHELGLADRIDCLRTVVRMTQPNLDLLPDNPLSKIPTLVLADGSVLIDSVVICEYLDSLAGGGILFPPSGPERWQALARHALGNGLLDILILWRNERDKPEQRQSPELHDSFAVKTRTTLDRLEADAADLGATRYGIGHIAIGCCLSYLDFRFADLGWRDGHPLLAAWHESFRARPSARATEAVDA
ncbi:glutathione S-transferase family protein [Plastoroseomonas hellenica]|uniref:glutathione S-transferase family protein n=1 Tax=Plastoroseomonas hellenica TaxID=2687306 RepID=UPI001BAADF0D|nr:glutathione S-transferase family protein [Plastoroseomonas hellenica]MBR0641517.1 glutathione S-transferase family protein [Plastoroseomonas hellenica]